MCSLGANLRVSWKSVKQNSRCLPQYSTLPTPFSYANPVTELEERNQVLSGESEHISKLGRHIDLPPCQLATQLGNQCIDGASVVIAIRLHLDDPPFPLQPMQQSRYRLAVACNKLTHARRFPVSSANIMRQVVYRLYVA